MKQPYSPVQSSAKQYSLPSLLNINHLLIAVSALCIMGVFYSSFMAHSHSKARPCTIVENTPGNKKPALINGVAAANQTNSVSDVVTAALAFKALLTTNQQSTLQQTFTNTLAQHWSNLPCGAQCRNGIQFSTLTAPQLAAAMAVIKAASGTTATEGYDEFTQIISADSVLGTVSTGGGYGKGIYFISYLNTPSDTSVWMLQYGGHHCAVNIAFNGGQVVGVTPEFKGVEPSWWTDGQTKGPMENEREIMVTMLASLTTQQLATAKLNTSFSDVVLGPNEDGNFPATKVGIQVSSLNSTQQNLIMQAMDLWLEDMDSASAATLRTIYQAELSGTYIAWTGTGTSGDSSTFLTTNTNYVRIDGPSVWIEMVCQSGVVYQTQTHFHSVWRDHTRDYGNYLAATSLGGTATGVSMIDKANSLNLYPNPATSQINATLPDGVTNALIQVTDITGKTVLSQEDVTGEKIQLNTGNLAKGTYLLRVQDKNHIYTDKFVKQ